MNIKFNQIKLIISELLSDFIVRYLFVGSILIFITDYLIWRNLLTSPDIYIYIRINLYPLQYLAGVFAINYFLAAISYRKEREISYLILLSNIIISLLILVLEIFYLNGSY